MQQSWIILFAAICSFSSSILFAIDLALERKMLGSGSVCVVVLAARERQPGSLFFAFSLYAASASYQQGITIHGATGVLAIHSGMPLESPYLWPVRPEIQC
jgi:hypothetical protein